MSLLVVKGLTVRAGSVTFFVRERRFYARGAVSILALMSSTVGDVANVVQQVKVVSQAVALRLVLSMLRSVVVGSVSIFNKMPSTVGLVDRLVVLPKLARWVCVNVPRGPCFARVDAWCYRVMRCTVGLVGRLAKRENFVLRAVVSRGAVLLRRQMCVLGDVLIVQKIAIIAEHAEAPVLMNKSAHSLLVFVLWGWRPVEPTVWTF